MILTTVFNLSNDVFYLCKVLIHPVGKFQCSYSLFSVQKVFGKNVFENVEVFSVSVFYFVRSQKGFSDFDLVSGLFELLESLDARFIASGGNVNDNDNNEDELNARSSRGSRVERGVRME